MRTLQLALNHGLDSQRIVLSGHPIRQEFYQRPGNIKQHRARLGLDPERFTVLFGASGNGSERMYEIITRLCKKSPQPLQALMITGKNVQLKKRLEGLNFPEQVKPKIYGQISDAQALADLFHACHLVVAKAGPNAVLEAVASGKPFIATHFIKGQETGNKNFIIATGIGFYEPKPKRVANLIRKLTEETAILDLMSKNIEREKSRHENAVRIIAEHMVDHLNAVD
jgi:UDP-N-acetylglucosamine:LPS N-acetylglucosamine transferase